MPGLVLVMLVTVPSAMVNAIARRPVVDGGRIALTLVILLTGLKMAAALLAPEPATQVGVVLGEGLLPLLLASWNVQQARASR